MIRASGNYGNIIFRKINNNGYFYISERGI